MKYTPEAEQLLDESTRLDAKRNEQVQLPNLSSQPSDTLSQMIELARSKQQALLKHWNFTTVLPTKVVEAPINWAGRRLGRTKNLVHFGNRRPFFYSQQSGEYDVLGHVIAQSAHALSGEQDVRPRHFDDVFQYNRSLRDIFRKLPETRRSLGPLGDDNCVDENNKITASTSDEQLREILLKGLKKLSNPIILIPNDDNETGRIGYGNMRFFISRILDIPDDQLPVAIHSVKHGFSDTGNMTLEDAKNEILGG